MGRIIRTLKKKLLRLRHLFPSALPIYKEEWDPFLNKVFDLYELPDVPNYRHAVCSMIMHLQKDTVTLRTLAASIRKAMTNQLAFHLIQQINEDEKRLLDEQKEVV